MTDQPEPLTDEELEAEERKLLLRLEDRWPYAEMALRLVAEVRRLRFETRWLHAELALELCDCPDGRERESPAEHEAACLYRDACELRRLRGVPHTKMTVGALTPDIPEACPQCNREAVERRVIWLGTTGYVSYDHRPGPVHQVARRRDVDPGDEEAAEPAWPPKHPNPAFRSLP